MVTKIALLAVVAAFASLNPDKEAPPDPPLEEGQHFCCQTIDPKSPSGNDCVLIDKTVVVACKKVLYCDGKYTYDDGKVTCY